MLYRQVNALNDLYISKKKKKLIQFVFGIWILEVVFLKLCHKMVVDRLDHKVGS